MVDEVVDRLGRLDVLVNNAGGSPRPTPPRPRPGSPSGSSPSTCSRRDLLLAARQPPDAAGRRRVDGQHRQRERLRPTPQTAAYGAAKAGLVNFTQTVAVEWAPKVRVNLVTAGMVRTEQSHLFYGDEAGIAEVGETVPLGRIADPDDIG